MKSLFIRWFTNSVALWVAMQLVPGIHAPDNIANLAIVVALFSAVDAMIRPVFWLLTCPLSLVTWGPFMLTLNALMLWFSAWLAGCLDLGFTVEGFVPALLGAIVVSIVRVIATGFLRSQERKRARIGELERYKVWLEEQRDNWKRLAEERERIIQEQRTSIGGLKPGKVWLEGRRDGQQQLSEVERDRTNWRIRIYLVLYRLYKPCYRWYTDQGWTWLSPLRPLRQKIKQVLLR